MKFSSITAASAHLREMTQEEMEKEAMLGKIISGGLSIAKSLVGKAGTGAARAATAPVRVPAKGAWNMVKKKPVMAGFAALTVAGEAGAARQMGRGHQSAMRNIKARGRANKLSQRQQTLYGGNQYAQTSGF